MRTPTEYTRNLKNKIITEKMLLDCLYSCNKRAKNWRDKEREYRDYYRSNYFAYDKYSNTERARKEKVKYYGQKEILLSILSPVCIHKELIGYERIRIYDYEKSYKKHLKKDDFVWQNCFWDDDFGREIWFGDIEDISKPKYHYYLFFDIGGDHTFHKPIEEKQICDFPELQVKKIDHLITYGDDISDLLSNQFVTKVVALIQNGDFVYIKNLEGKNAV